MAMNFVRSSNQRVASISSFNPASIISAGTVTCWCSLASSSGNIRLIGVNTNFEARTGGANMIHEFYQSGTLPQYTLTLNTEYCLVFTWNQAGTLKELWANGIRQSFTTSATFGSSASGTLYLGASGTSLTECWNGWADDIRIYNRTLSQGEIETIYNARGRDLIYNGLLYRWVFIEGAPGVAASGTGLVKDIIGGLHMTPTNSPTFRDSTLNSLR